MYKNILQERLDQKSPLTEEFAASFLATEGKEFNEKLEETYEEHRVGFPTTRLFTFGIIESLFFGKFLIYSKRAFQLAFDYFANDNTAIFDNLAQIGEPDKKVEHLQNLLISWKTIQKRLGKEVLVASATANEIFDYQKLVFHQAPEISGSKTGLRGIKAWTLSAPFKVIIVCRKDLWKDKNTDRIFLPLGSKVLSGLNFLNKKFPLNGYKYPKIKGNLQTELDHFKRIHEECEEKLATLADSSRIIHINSGLYLLGKKDESQISNI